MFFKATTAKHDLRTQGAKRGHLRFIDSVNVAYLLQFLSQFCKVSADSMFGQILDIRVDILLSPSSFFVKLQAHFIGIGASICSGQESLCTS